MVRASARFDVRDYFYVYCVRWRWCCTGGCESHSQGGYTALMYAAYSGHVDCVRLLIDAGADKDATTNVRF